MKVFISYALSLVGLGFVVATVTGAAYDPGPLAPGTTYYWRVDEVNAYGTRHGWTWRFTTAP